VRLAKNEPRLIIEHSLKNTGKKTIETNVYNHGFFVIDGQPSGPDFTVKFPFDVKAVADLQGLAEVQGKELHYLKELQPGGQSVFTQLTGYGDSAAISISAWRIARRAPECTWRAIGRCGRSISGRSAPRSARKTLSI
jgi:hypothetical protein